MVIIEKHKYSFRLQFKTIKSFLHTKCKILTLKKELYLKISILKVNEVQKVEL